MRFEEVVTHIGDAVELAGVLVIVVGVAWSLTVFVIGCVRRRASEGLYHQTRRLVGRSILLGLELLVAGDIIRTVILSPSFTSVGVLAAIVLIRTFLSFTLELEINGRWPWQRD
jgi:uncharacterized membrane protein